MTIQFKRTYELIIGTPNSGKGLQIIGNEDTNEGLQIQFRISKHIDNSENSNSATISIVNLSEDSINYIQKPNMAIILKVGWQGDNKVLFEGIIKEVETDDRTSRQDRATTLRCVPATTLVYEPTISKTFPANTTPRQIINYLVGQSTTLSRASFNSDNIDQAFPFGYSVEGNAKSILNELARDFQFQYRIDGNRIYVNDPNKYQSPNSVERAFVISPSSGLLGVPTHASADGKRTKDDTNRKDGIRFRALINPLIQPGSAVSIKDTVLPGIYRVNSTEFSGDWRSNEWSVTCHCAKLNGSEI